MFCYGKMIYTTYNFHLREKFNNYIKYKILIKASFVSEVGYLYKFIKIK